VISVFKIYAKTLSIGLCWSCFSISSIYTSICTSKSGFGGISGGRLTLEMKWYSRNILTIKTRLVVHWPLSHVVWTLTVDCRRSQETKKTSPLVPPYTPKAAYINFGMWSRVLDIVNHAKFQLDRFRGFGAPDGRKSLSPIDWRYRPYNRVRTNVLLLLLLLLYYGRRRHRHYCLCCCCCCWRCLLCFYYSFTCRRFLLSNLAAAVSLRTSTWCLWMHSGVWRRSNSSAWDSAATNIVLTTTTWFWQVNYHTPTDGACSLDNMSTAISRALASNA